MPPQEPVFWPLREPSLVLCSGTPLIVPSNTCLVWLGVHMCNCTCLQGLCEGSGGKGQCAAQSRSTREKMTEILQRWDHGVGHMKRWGETEAMPWGSRMGPLVASLNKRKELQEETAVMKQGTTSK